jgi:hypothetical protein
MIIDQWLRKPSVTENPECRTNLHIAPAGFGPDGNYLNLISNIDYLTKAARLRRVTGANPVPALACADTPAPDRCAQPSPLPLGVQAHLSCGTSPTTECRIASLGIPRYGIPMQSAAWQRPG